MASMSPWRDVPRPRYTPSLYDVFAADFTTGVAAGAAVKGAGVDTGAGAVSAGAGVEAGADRIDALDVAACATAVGATAVGATAVGATTVGATAVGATAVGGTAVGSTTVGDTVAGGTTVSDAETGVVPVAGSAGWTVATCAEGDGDTSDDFTTVVVTAGVATAPGVAAGDAAGSSTADDADNAETVRAADSPTAVRTLVAPVLARDALRGRRTAFSAAIRSAAGLVLAKPAA